jgi:hypothetical protein
MVVPYNFVGPAVTATVSGEFTIVSNGQIDSPIVIGDDYLAANSRAFQFTITAIAGMTVGTAECKFGVFHSSKGSFSVDGTVTDAGDDEWLLSFDVPKSKTGLLEPGEFDWAVEVLDSSAEITCARNSTDCAKVSVVRKGT